MLSTLCTILLVTQTLAAPLSIPSAASGSSSSPDSLVSGPLRRRYYYAYGYTTSPAAIIGAGVGVAILLLVLFLRFYFVLRARKARRAMDPPVTTPAVEGASMPPMATYDGAPMQPDDPNFQSADAQLNQAQTESAAKTQEQSAYPGYAVDGGVNGNASGSGQWDGVSSPTQPPPAYIQSSASFSGYSSGNNNPVVYEGVQAHGYEPQSSGQNGAPEIRYTK